MWQAVLQTACYFSVLQCIVLNCSVLCHITRILREDVEKRC